MLPYRWAYSARRIQREGVFQEWQRGKLPSGFRGRLSVIGERTGTRWSTAWGKVIKMLMFDTGPLVGTALALAPAGVTATDGPAGACKVLKIRGKVIIKVISGMITLRCAA